MAHPHSAWLGCGAAELPLSSCALPACVLGAAQLRMWWRLLDRASLCRWRLPVQHSKSDHFMGWALGLAARRSWRCSACYGPVWLPGSQKLCLGGHRACAPRGVSAATISQRCSFAWCVWRDGEVCGVQRRPPALLASRGGSRCRARGSSVMCRCCGGGVSWARGSLIPVRLARPVYRCACSAAVCPWLSGRAALAMVVPTVHALLCHHWGGVGGVVGGVEWALVEGGGARPAPQVLRVAGREHGASGCRLPAASQYVGELLARLQSTLRRL
jgi:hypothetical protein